jgi:hypothetical protein
MTTETGMLLVKLSVGPSAVFTRVRFTLSVPSLCAPPLTGSTLKELVAEAATVAHVGLPGTTEPVAACATDGPAPVPICAGLNAVMRFRIRKAAIET